MTKKKLTKKRVYKPTAKQLMFCKEFTIDRNGKQAAIRAKYSEKTAEQQASRLLRNVKLKEEIDKLTAAQSKRTEIDADYVLGNIVEIGERCMQKTPVMVKEGKGLKQKTEEIDGAEVDVWEFKETGALKAQELLGKHLKMFTDKKEHTFPDGVPVEVVQLDKKEYAKARKKMLKKDDC